MTDSTRLSFSDACEYLSLSAEAFVSLREQGLIAFRMTTEGQAYLKESLEITQRLLEIGRTRGWSVETLVWYADLLFASNVGRAIFLPLHERAGNMPSQTWLAMDYNRAVLETLAEGEDFCDGAITSPLASLVTLAVGKDRFWLDTSALTESAVAPIVSYLEAKGTNLVAHDGAYVRDAGMIFAAMLFAFTVIALPTSSEFAALVKQASQDLKDVDQISVSEAERALIKKEPLIPVDKLYASKATEIHSQPERWNFKLGLVRADRRTIAVQMKLPEDADEIMIDNILDMVRPFLGPFGARAVQLLYEIANDAPYYRNPVITIDTNEMLDRLGLKRDERGIHRSKNRARLRDALNAAHALEVVGEFTTWEKGKQVRKAFYRTVLSIIGATFDPEESATIATADLRTRGLPKSVQIRLNFYDGIRRPDGTLGNQFALVPRLTPPNVDHTLPSANYSKTHELLKAYLLFRYRQTRMASRQIVVTRQTALEKANITNKNASKATITLRKALDNLVADRTLESYSTPLPTKPHLSFEVVLSEHVVYNLSKDQS